MKYYGSYFKNTDLWIVMEYCGAGSVSDIIRLRNKTVRVCLKKIHLFTTDCLLYCPFTEVKYYTLLNIKKISILLLISSVSLCSYFIFLFHIS